MTKYRYQYNQNPEYVTVHVDGERLIYTSFINDAVRGFQKDNDLHKTLLAVPGVEEINIHPYSVTARIGRAFDRTDILDDLLDILIWNSKSEKIDIIKLPTIDSEL